MRGVVQRQFGRWDDSEQDEFFARDWEGGKFEILECEGTRCGYACVEDRERDVHVRELVVAPLYQRRGIGTAIIDQAIHRARRRDVAVVLGTLNENEAVRLFRRFGFVESGTTSTHTLFRLDP